MLTDAKLFRNFAIGSHADKLFKNLLAAFPMNKVVHQKQESKG